MNLGRRKRVHSAVEASSLSDILFFLLLFFLIISTLASPNAIKLLLPKASTGQTIPKHLINVAINAQMDYYVEKKKVSFEEITGELAKVSQKVIAQAETPTVLLRVDKSISVEEFIKVVDLVNKLKIPMVVATDKGKK